MEINKDELNLILDALEFGDFYDLYDNTFFDNIVRPFKNKYKKNFSYDYGASKGVLIFKDFNYVIKIPFVKNEDEDFCGASGNKEWDYCDAEVLKYQEAEKEGLNNCFAKTIKIGEIDNYPIYLQEYAEIFNQINNKTPSRSKEDLEKVSELCQNYYCFNKEWLSDVLNFYGEQTFYHLMNFIDDYDIKDLHGANLGYIGLRPVLVDYSSFDH